MQDKHRLLIICDVWGCQTISSMCSSFFIVTSLVLEGYKIRMGDCYYWCVCLQRMRRTSTLFGHHLRSLTTLLFFSHQSGPSSWQNQFYVCMYRMVITGHVSECVRVWEWVTVRNDYLQADITKHPAILSSVCGGDTVSVQTGVYF